MVIGTWDILFLQTLKNGLSHEPKLNKNSLLSDTCHALPNIATVELATATVNRFLIMTPWGTPFITRSVFNTTPWKILSQHELFRNIFTYWDVFKIYITNKLNRFD